ncbi:S8 family serine peptidase [Tractidigestivibacter sp.]|uniref:S8 family serine peptidase n=1 Tax=Tractidigestivibacter sp. TaxID=2847320 RepID=UPI002A919542|nr:S8 family serine peptidase [Tractidigestivibacter sp.]MDY5271537.1 S8 family serine peptidase [Tractidigestivibacter sp.]
MGMREDGRKRAGGGGRPAWRKAAPVLLVALALVAAAVVVGVAGHGGSAGASDAPAPAGAAAQGPSDAPADTGEATKSSPSGGPSGPSQDDATAGDGGSSPSGGDGTAGGAGYEEGVILLRVSDAQSAADIDDALAQLDCVGTRSVSDQDLSNGFVRVTTAEGVSVEDAVVQLGDVGLDSQPNYAYALADDEGGGQDASGPASLVSAELGTGAAAGGGQTEALAAASLTNDPYLSATGLGSANYQGFKDTKVAEAWDLVQTDKAVSVAVLDTGFRTSHEDLRDNVVATYDATVANEANGLTGEVANVTDVKGHGTHVAGIVAAEANNAKGVAGTSHNAGIVGVKVFPTRTFETPGGTTKKKDGCYTDDLVCAYNYVIQNASSYNIRVVNLSVAGALPSMDAILASYIEEAYDQGIVTVCAAGNQGPKLVVPFLSAPADLPARFVAVMNVAYDNGEWALSRSSNYNTPTQSSDTSNKNICAPGASILSTLRTGDSSYGRLSGTSMASPWVAGVLAMEFAANGSLSAEKAIDYLYESATDLGDAGWDRQTGYGLVNAYQAVSLAKESAAPPPEDISGAGMAAIPSQTYTGSAITPGVTVTFGEATLVEGADYTVAYANNVKPGTATVTITGIGGYTGAKSVTFTIAKPPAAETAPAGKGKPTDKTTAPTDKTTGKGKPTGKPTAPTAPTDKGRPTAPTARTVPMYRLYNKWSGEHLFTTSYSEYSHLASIGWTQENIAWHAPASGGTPVWRLYNPYSGDHLYTADPTEYSRLGKIGWRQEGESFRSADPSSGGAPIFRLYNPWLTAGTHLFTTSYSEYSGLGSIGWRQEGTAFYAAK